MVSRMKATKAIVHAVRILFVLAAIGALALGLRSAMADGQAPVSHLIAAFTALLSLGLTFIPNLLEYENFLVLPPSIKVFYTLFVLCAMLLGEILDFYTLFAWWDSMLHLLSGVLFSFVGYLLFTSLNRNDEVRNQLNPMSVVLVSVCFALACGGVWEIFEFAGDSLLGMNMQRWQSGMDAEQWALMQNFANTSNPGLIDTMKDIIVDTVGAALSIPVLLPMIKKHNIYARERTAGKQTARGRALLPDSQVAIDME